MTQILLHLREAATGASLIVVGIKSLLPCPTSLHLLPPQISVYTWEHNT